MKTVNKLLALLLTLALLVSVPVAAFAEETIATVFDDEVLHSITVEEKTGNGLAFLFNANVSGTKKNALHVADYTNATVTLNGEEYQVVSMGAVMVNQPEDIANIDNITVEQVDNDNILNVPAKHLLDASDDACSFIVRIIRIPVGVPQGMAIAARPYVLLEKDGVESIVYGNSDIATYNQLYYQNNLEETPVLDLSALGNVDDRIAASASAEYVAYETVNYKEAFKVSLTLENVSTNAKTSAGDSVTYAFKDAEGNELGSETVAVDELTAGDSKTVEFYAPIGTATIEQAAADLNYVPVITLPAIGSDIDVTKKKNRIRVSAATASFNEDGTIHVALAFTNYTTNWITEETDYVQYTYYNAAGTKIKTATIYIGVIDTKKNKTKTFEFDLPATAASVKITKSKIVYWTEWA